jgi:hypothetical protein
MSRTSWIAAAALLVVICASGTWIAISLFPRQKALAKVPDDQAAHLRWRRQVQGNEATKAD